MQNHCPQYTHSFVIFIALPCKSCANIYVDFTWKLCKRIRQYECSYFKHWKLSTLLHSLAYHILHQNQCLRKALSPRSKSKHMAGTHKIWLNFWVTIKSRANKRKKLIMKRRKKDKAKKKRFRAVYRIPEGLVIHSISYHIYLVQVYAICMQHFLFWLTHKRLLSP